jgi:hypothetical protein
MSYIRNQDFIASLTSTSMIAFTGVSLGRPFAMPRQKSVIAQQGNVLQPTKLFATTEQTKIHTADIGFQLNPRRFKKSTKQIATVGPSCNTLEMIERLFLSGADVFRLNFSHGEHSEKLKIIKFIRRVEHKYGHPIAILADLQVRTLHSPSYSTSSRTHKFGVNKHSYSLIFFNIVGGLWVLM